MLAYTPHVARMTGNRARPRGLFGDLERQATLPFPVGVRQKQCIGEGGVRWVSR